MQPQDTSIYTLHLTLSLCAHVNHILYTTQHVHKQHVYMVTFNNVLLTGSFKLVTRDKSFAVHMFSKSTMKRNNLRDSDYFPPVNECTVN